MAAKAYCLPRGGAGSSQLILLVFGVGSFTFVDFERGEVNGVGWHFAVFMADLAAVMGRIAALLKRAGRDENRISLVVAAVDQRQVNGQVKVVRSRGG